MDAKRLVSLMMIPLAAIAVGCRSSNAIQDAYFDTVNAEKMALEDHIYELAHENTQLRDELSKLKTSPTSAAGGGTGDESYDGDYGPLVVPPSNGGSGRPSIDAPVNPDLSNPMTQPGVEADPKEIFPGLESDSRVGQGDASLATIERPSSSVEQTPADMIASPNSMVTHLHINRVATRGRNTDGQPGDDMLVIGLEPRDRFGRFVPAASDVDLVLLDPDQKGAAARIAQWRFDASTVAEGAQHAGSTPMILLEAAWPKRPPTNSRLQLWARFTTSDGRILQTRETIHITPSGDLSARWTPRTQSPAARMATRPDEPPEWSPNR